MKECRQHNSGIGGQAVLEGVMMRNKDKYAIAVRRSDGSIVIKKETYKGILADSPLKKIPFVRGVFVFIDSIKSKSGQVDRRQIYEHILTFPG